MDPLIKSLKSKHGEARTLAGEQQAQCTEPKRTEVQQEPVNKGHSEAQVSGQKQALVPQGDSASPGAEHCAAKLNHKQDNKRILHDQELASVIEAWPSLPEPIRAGILAMVQAARPKQAET